MTGFAVVDLETTGFAYNTRDRICEIGVVLLDADGRREDAYTTLVNPQRDLGAQHVHGIDATDARIAPLFADVVGDLTELLAGRVLVAHNATFDTAFLTAEYARAGFPVDLRDAALCTMRLAPAFGAPAKLGECCRHFGIRLDGAHAALNDAEATAQVLQRYLAVDAAVAHPWRDCAGTMRWPAPAPRATTPVVRGAAAPGSGLLARVIAGFDLSTDILGGAEYLDLLGRVLVDERITSDERAALSALARRLGLGTAQQDALHRRYLLGVVDAVCADDVITPRERALIIKLARLLDRSDLEVEALLAHASSLVSRVSAGIDLNPGDLVVFTGFGADEKARLGALAASRGLGVHPSVKKAVAAVIALDPGSNSGKARKAREYGIPVVGAHVLEG
ncbi:exonuclease domain-containing protein [Demequina pelophila]|uniref:exonuclease domain-containing protein n=1 Tax=Demequina pelophila TaxID=1638984 RepID=UPI000785BC65|nr:exonuclease domain-containing protein [Demequina pelophila]